MIVVMFKLSKLWFVFESTQVMLDKSVFQPQILVIPCLFHRADLFNVEQIQHLLDYKPPWREMFLKQRENLSAKVGGSLIVREVCSSVSFSYEMLSPCRSQSMREENHLL